MKNKPTPKKPSVKDLKHVLRVFEKLDGSGLLTVHEETALAIVSNAVVAISDPKNLHKYEHLGLDLETRSRVIVTVTYRPLN